MDTVFIIGIFLSFFLQFLLLTKKYKTLSDKILALWMFIIGIHLFSSYIYHLGYWDKYPHLVGITHPFPYLHGPLLYLYTVFSLRSDQRFSWKDYMHFAPFILSYIYMIKYFFFYTAEQKYLMDHGELDDYRGFMYLSLMGFIISGIVYPILSYRLLGKYKRLIKQNFSYEESINLNWLKYCIWSIGLIYLTVAVVMTMKEAMGMNFNENLIIYSMFILFIFMLGYFGIKHQGVFSDNTLGNQLAEPKSVGEYKKSGLKEDSAEEYHQQLLKIMKEKKPFLESKLTLNTLARELNISINHLSQIINQYQGKNFYDFINEYRIEEFKLRVSSPENRNFSILAIAYDSGFNSKSSFNYVFKKHTGKTPSQYMAEIA